ncbi:pseudouridine synthase [Candidatus Vidania fulgoroideorum]
MKKIYEDNYILVIKKPIGLKVHKGGVKSENLIDKIKEKLKKIHLLNRIDRYVSGLVFLKKNVNCNIYLKKKIYIAIAFRGNFVKNINIPIYKNKNYVSNFLTKVSIDGKKSSSNIEILKSDRKFLYLKISIKTGRTHQIRQHLSYIGSPILGDPIYGNFKLNKMFFKTNNKIKRQIYLFNKEVMFKNKKLKTNKTNKIKIKTPIDFIKVWLHQKKKFQYQKKE